jgi:hypothetical protein
LATSKTGGGRSGGHRRRRKREAAAFRDGRGELCEGEVLASRRGREEVARKKERKNIKKGEGTYIDLMNE